MRLRKRRGGPLRGFGQSELGKHLLLESLERRDYLGSLLPISLQQLLNAAELTNHAEQDPHVTRKATRILPETTQSREQVSDSSVQRGRHINTSWDLLGGGQRLRHGGINFLFERNDSEFWQPVLERGILSAPRLSRLHPRRNELLNRLWHEDNSPAREASLGGSGRGAQGLLAGGLSATSPARFNPLDGSAAARLPRGVNRIPGIAFDSSLGEGFGRSVLLPELLETGNGERSSTNAPADTNSQTRAVDSPSAQNSSPPLELTLNGFAPIYAGNSGVWFVTGSLGGPGLRADSAPTLTLLRADGSQVTQRTLVASDSTPAKFGLIVEGVFNQGEVLRLRAEAGPGRSVETSLNVQLDSEDTDGDGITDAVENWGGPAGDWNADGTPDARQARVATLPSAQNDKFFSVVTTDGVLRGVHSLKLPANSEDYARMPFGQMEFAVAQLSPGATARVELVFPAEVAVQKYLKDAGDGTREEFFFDGSTGAIATENRVVLHLRDGGRGDADGVADGVILDPGGPVTGILQLSCNADNPLLGWAFAEHGGQGNGAGRLDSHAADIRIHEGNSLLAEVQKTVTLPSDAQILEFEYGVTFDGASTGRIQDAFEVGLFDADGKSVVPTIGFPKETFFNLTEGESVQTGEKAKHFAAQTPGDQRGLVQLDISKLAPQSVLTLKARVVNNDGDTDTTARLICAGPPVTKADQYTLQEGQSLQVDVSSGVLANDRPAGNGLFSLKAQVVKAPQHGNLQLQPDGRFTYTPEPTFFGSDQFEYIANDGRMDSSRTLVTLLVTGVPSPTVGKGDHYSTDEDRLLVVSGRGVLANDSDPDDAPRGVGAGRPGAARRWVVYLHARCQCVWVHYLPVSRAGW